LYRKLYSIIEKASVAFFLTDVTCAHPFLKIKYYFKELTLWSNCVRQNSSLKDRQLPFLFLRIPFLIIFFADFSRVVKSDFENKKHLLSILYEISKEMIEVQKV